MNTIALNQFSTKSFYKTESTSKPDITTTPKREYLLLNAWFWVAVETVALVSYGIGYAVSHGLI